MKFSILAVAALLATATVARAEPLDNKQVPADAKWLVHVDVDAMRSSIVIKNAYEQCMEKHPEAAKHFDKVKGMLGMDPRSDLHDVTVYGKDTDKHHGVLIVHATVDKQLLVDKAAKAPDHKVTKYGDYEVHSWTHKDPHGSHAASGAFFKPDVLVFAENVDGVKAALDVLDGKTESIEAKSALGKKALPGTILMARAIEIDPKMPCALLKQTESFAVSIGENDGKSFYRARLIMKSNEAAEQVVSINQGFQALVSLKFGSDPDVAKLLEGLKTSAKENQVRVYWSASADDVWTVVQKAAKMAEQHWAHHGKPGAKKDGPKKDGK